MQAATKKHIKVNSGFFVHTRKESNPVKIEANTLDEFEKNYNLFSAVNLLIKHTKLYKLNLTEELKQYPDLKFNHDKNKLQIFFNNGSSVDFTVDNSLSQNENTVFYTCYDIEHVTYVDENNNVFEIV